VLWKTEKSRQLHWKRRSDNAPEFFGRATIRIQGEQRKEEVATQCTVQMLLSLASQLSPAYDGARAARGMEARIFRAQRGGQPSTALLHLTILQTRKEGTGVGKVPLKNQREGKSTNSVAVLGCQRTGRRGGGRTDQGGSIVLSNVRSRKTRNIRFYILEYDSTGLLHTNRRYI